MHFLFNILLLFRERDRTMIGQIEEEEGGMTEAGASGRGAAGALETLGGRGGQK